MFKNLVFKEITSLRLKLEKCQRIGSKNGILIQNLKKQEEKLISIEKRITNQSNVEELDLFQDGIQSLLKATKVQKEQILPEIEEFSDANLKKLNQRIDRLGTIYNPSKEFQLQKFFSFDDFTWSKELSDRWTFLKQNFCHKKPKVPRH